MVGVSLASAPARARLAMHRFTQLWGQRSASMRKRNNGSLVPPGPLFISVFRGPGTRSHVTL